jgi:predicted Zn-dependent peptidase
MKARFLLAAAAAVSCALGSVAHAATGDLPNLGARVDVGHLAAGGEYIVRPALGAPVAAIELWYRAPATGFGAKPVPSVARLAAQVVASSKPIVGDTLGKQIADVGGRLGITVYSDSISISAVVPAQAARDIVKAMTTAYFAPVITDDGYRGAVRDVQQEALLESFNPESVARDAVFEALFATGPQHFPAVGNPRDVPAISENDVRAFATRAFRSQNAVLVVSGAVDPSVQSAAVAGRPGDFAPEMPANPEIAAGAPNTVTKDFDEPSGGYGWTGPPIASEREATAMDFIADYLFRPDAGTVSRSVSEAYPDALVSGQFITLRDPGVMFIVYSGKNTEGIRAKVDEGLAAIRKPLDAKSFAAALDAFKYHLMSDLQTPTEMADNFGWYSVEGNPEYAPGAGGEGGAYFKAAATLTPDFVAATAQKYLGKAPVTVSLRPQEKPKSQ